MLKFLTQWLPVVVVLATIFNIFASYAAGNESAIYANVVALSGWAVIAVESFKKRSQYESNI